MALGVLEKCSEISIFLFLCTYPHKAREVKPYKFLVCPLGVGGSREAPRAVSATVRY